MKTKMIWTASSPEGDTRYAITSFCYRSLNTDGEKTVPGDNPAFFYTISALKEGEMQNNTGCVVKKKHYAN